MGYPYHTTPKKAKIQGAVEFLEAKKIPHFKSDIFKQFGVSYPTGWRYLREPDSYGSRTYHSAFPDRRGRKSKISDQDLATIERFIESNGFDGRTIPYAALPAAAGLDLDVSARTVRRAVGSLDFRFCVACQKQWAS
jgi:transposase